MRWRRIAPGLYERIDTPKRVDISGRLMDAVRAESPYLADVLTKAEQGCRVTAPERRRCWQRW